MTFDQVNLQYKIAPENPDTDLGTFTVKVNLTDTNLYVEENFEVTVFNDPPYFKQPLLD
jgi:hypothetical protein